MIVMQIYGFSLNLILDVYVVYISDSVLNASLPIFNCYCMTIRLEQLVFGLCLFPGILVGYFYYYIIFLLEYSVNMNP